MLNGTDRASTSFEPGAVAAHGTVPLSVPEIRGNEWSYVKECLDTNWVSSAGAYVDRFERMLAERAGVAHGVATVNGTAAIHMALIVAGIEPGDEVITSALSFIAPANAIRYAGAWPVFIDIEPEYWQIDPAKVVAFIERECERRDGVLVNRTTGRRVKAILPVDILGHPVDIDPIAEVARAHDLAIIEDATESLGATYKGRPVGSLGDLGCFSFNGNKIITTGGGGMIVTASEALARRAKYLTTQAKDDPLEYVHGEVGYNYRLPNILAAMGCAQMELLDEYIAAKRAIAARYERAFGEIPGITPMRQAPWAESTFWLYTVIVDEREYGIDSRALLRALSDAGVQTRPLWQPLHLSAAMVGSHAYGIEHVTAVHRDALSIPCSVGLTEAEQERVIDAIANNRKVG